MEITFNSKKEFQGFVNELRKPKKLEYYEELWERIFALYDKISDDAYEKFCKGGGEMEWYVGSMIHESGAFAGNTINNLRNWYYWNRQKDVDSRHVIELRKKFIHNLYMFCIMAESLERITLA